MARRVSRIPRSVVRPVMAVGGGERAPTAVVGGLGLGLLALAWNMRSLIALATGLLLLTVGLYALRRIAMADSQMFAVYARSLRYRRYHRSFSTPWRRS